MDELLRQLETELARLLREEDYLALQTRRAREQVRYYEQLLADLKREWGRRAPLSDLVRRLGQP
jgi:multidrug resistance efflux pump